MITAVQLNLETAGFTYQKWGGEQRCKAGDWLVNSDGETYTIDSDSFARTYREHGPGLYVKVGCVWAEQAGAAGSIRTKEGKTSYEAGDWLVYNGADRTDGYAVKPEKFKSLYEEAGD